MGNDPRRITDKFARIEREYEGAVDLTLLRITGFERLDTLNARFHFCGVDETSGWFFFTHSTCRFFGIGIIEMGFMDTLPTRLP